MNKNEMIDKIVEVFNERYFIEVVEGLNWVSYFKRLKPIEDMTDRELKILFNRCMVIRKSM